MARRGRGKVRHGRRGLSAAAIGKQFVCYLALDSASDAEKAVALLKKL